MNINTQKVSREYSRIEKVALINYLLIHSHGRLDVDSINGIVTGVFDHFESFKGKFFFVNDLMSMIEKKINQRAERLKGDRVAFMVSQYDVTSQWLDGLMDYFSSGDFAGKGIVDAQFGHGLESIGHIEFIEKPPLTDGIKFIVGIPGLRDVDGKSGFFTYGAFPGQVFPCQDRDQQLDEIRTKLESILSCDLLSDIDSAILGEESKEEKVDISDEIGPDIIAHVQLVYSMMAISQMEYYIDKVISQPFTFSSEDLNESTKGLSETVFSDFMPSKLSLDELDQSKYPSLTEYLGRVDFGHVAEDSGLLSLSALDSDVSEELQSLLIY